ncbi:MAG: T9SS type A sorting domain-containing protein [bacterium]|nr:T9SS type A sorting domain-containing protein [bacterium]
MINQIRFSSSFYGIVISILLVGVIQATELRLVQTNYVPNAGRLTHFKPFIDTRGVATGFVACDASTQALRIERFDSPSLSRIIQLPGEPYDITYYFSGDSLIVYAAYYTVYNLRIGRFVLANDTIVQNDIPVQYVNHPEYWSDFFEMEYLSIHLDSSNALAPVSVVLEWYCTYSWYDATQGYEDMTKSHSMVTSLDLSQVFSKGSNKYHLQGEFLPRPGRETFGIIASTGVGSYCDPWDCRSWYYVRNSVILWDAADSAIYERYFDTSIVSGALSGDLDDSRDGEEVVVAGYHRGLDNEAISGDNFVAAYSFASGRPQEIWRKQPMNGQVTFTPLCFWEGPDLLLLQRPSIPRVILIWHADTGEKFDSLYFYGPLVPRDFLILPDRQSGFSVFGGAGDSTYYYVLDIMTDVDDDLPPLPSAFTLSQNYPNPFNASTEICFSLERAADVTLTVHNLLGQGVKTLVDGRTSAGEHRVTWDGTDDSGESCATGVYLYRLQTEDRSESRKMLLLK